jgi:FkbM family methyltransferase
MEQSVLIGKFVARFYGQFRPPVDQLLYEHYFRDHVEGTFIEAGAHDGVSYSSCKFFEEFLGWRGFNLEPSTPLFEHLVNNRPLATNVHVALSDRAGTAALRTRHDHSFGGTLRDVRGDARFQVEMAGIRTLTYAGLIDEYAIATVDLCVLDVEGHELEVLDGMRECATLPRVLVVEHSLVPFREICRRVAPLGYQCDFRRRVNSYFSRPAPQ